MERAFRSMESQWADQEAYCEQEGISYNSFVYQHNRLTSEPKKTPLHFIESKVKASTYE